MVNHQDVIQEPNETGVMVFLTIHNMEEVNLCL
jgi:hypothetical protein